MCSGTTHAATGAAIGVAAIPLLASATNVVVLSPLPLITLTLATAAGALLPDLDDTPGHASRSLGPITQATARFTRWYARGHRGWTHSIAWSVLAGLAVTVALPWLGRLLAPLVPSGLAGGIPHTGLTEGWFFPLLFLWWLLYLALFVLAGAARKLNLPARLGRVGAMLTATGLTGALYATQGPETLTALLTGPLAPLTAAITIGCLAHILPGDGLTTQGLGHLWDPWPRGRQFGKVRCNLLGTTGEAPELVLGAGFLLLGGATLTGQLTDADWVGTPQTITLALAGALTFLVITTNAIKRIPVVGEAWTFALGAVKLAFAGAAKPLEKLVS